jgi:hypothetical protein
VSVVSIRILFLYVSGKSAPGKLSVFHFQDVKLKHLDVAI